MKCFVRKDSLHLATAVLILSVWWNINYVFCQNLTDRVTFCYFATYADHRPGRGNFKLSDISGRCTHVVFAFAHMNETDNSIQPLALWPDLKRDPDTGESNLMIFKQRHPDWKITVAVGGWEDGSIKYSNMVADPVKRTRFVNGTIDFLKEHNFDGIDLVWQYPSKRGGRKQDKLNFVKLVQELRTVYDEHDFLLTASLDSSKDTIDYSYEVPELSKYLHYMLVQTYDYHGRWSRFIGHNAPLYGSDILNTAYTIEYLLKLGADRAKLVLGVPLYGRTFIATDKIDTTAKLPGIGQKFKDTFPGPFTEESGYMGFNEICLEFARSPREWTVYWDDYAKVPFAVNGDKFISYDNVESVREKVMFSKRKNLAGVVAWSVDTDDFRLDCLFQQFDEQYPLLSSIYYEQLRTTVTRVNVKPEVDGDSSDSNKLRTSIPLILLVIKFIYDVL